MNVKCEWCNNYYDENLTNCPSCGAPNEHIHRTSDGQPKTIEDLKEWYQAHNLPPEEVTRFFIGKDIRQPRAFGIYKQADGKCVVYKNKANGERAVRYEGTDEAYAVNELYQRLKEEIVNQKRANANRQSTRSTSPSGFGQRPRKRRSIIRILVIVFVVTQILPTLVAGSFYGVYSHFAYKSGYYIDKDSDLVCYSQETTTHPDQSEWYVYHDDTLEWTSQYSKPDGVERKEWVGTTWTSAMNEQHPLQSSYTDMLWYKKAHTTLPSGYYTYDETPYYYQNGSWYQYTDNEWNPIYDIADDFYLDGTDYYDSQFYSDTSGYTSFEDSDYYEEPSYSGSSDYSTDNDNSWNDNDWDSGTSWNSGNSWDSGTTNWDSDW